MTDDQHAAPSDKSAPWGMRVYQLRVAAGLTQDVLADKVGTTKATISKIERSTGAPKTGWIERLADALNVDAATLAFGREPERRASVMVPVIGMIAAGNWREAVQSPDGFIPVVEARPHMFALRVHGDSIDRIAPDGSYVSIDPTDPTLVEGGLYAVQNAEGEATVKRFRRGPDRLEPDSTNEAHKPILLGSEPITVIGRATSVTQLV